MSKKSEYALRALLSMSRHPMGHLHTLQEISTREAIPGKFLEQILAQLKKAGILSSRRGSQGGYFLGRPASQIFVGEVLDLIEGSKTATISEEKNASSGRALTILRIFQKEVDKKTHELLYRRSLEDLLKLDPQHSPMNFEI